MGIKKSRKCVAKASFLSTANMAEKDVFSPFVKHKCSYRVCEHCSRELSVKIYREHKRLYYNPTTNTWAKDHEELSQCSSELSSEDIEVLNDQQIPEHSESDGIEWENESAEEQTGELIDLCDQGMYRIIVTSYMVYVFYCTILIL